MLIVALTLLLSVCASVADAQWLETKADHYTIFFQAGYEKDAEFARSWMNRAEQLMKDKYGVTPGGYHMSVYLHPTPTGTASVDHARNHCCSETGAGIRTGTIDVLTPSAQAWRASTFVSSLGLPKSDESYQAKVLISEYIPIGHWTVQATRPDGGWKYYSAPNWFVQGLQEYDAIFHSTDANRTATAARLLEWAKNNSAKFSCCSSGLSIGDDYNGGAAFMAFLAAQFGEDVHAKLLRSSAPTFDAALAEVTEPYSLPELFDRFRSWLAGAQP